MFNVRNAVEEDAHEACAVLIRSIREVYAKDYPDEDDKIFGFSAANLSGEILLNYLVPEALYKHNGKAMLAALESQVRKHGVENIRVTSSITAKKFYARNGFIKNGEPLK